MSYTYNFPTLWTGKSDAAVVTERHDIVLLFDATNCNPNGDPDTGNMPRLQPDTLRGLVTDVCLKRKVRNFWGLYPPQPARYDIFIRESAILGNVITSSHLALMENRCATMLEKMRTEGFLSQGDHEEVAATLKATERKEWPQKSEGCEEFVAKACKGKFDYSATVPKMAPTLALESEVPQGVRDALTAAQLSNDQKADAEKTWKAIEKACADALPQGTKVPNKKLVLKLVRQAFEANSPEAAVAIFSKMDMERANRDALCQTYADVRSFGAVVSTEGPLAGSFYGQIRGPLQITFAESLDKILQLDFSITRCAIASEPKKKKWDQTEGGDSDEGGDSSDNRTMGRKHTVPYGLYRCHIHFSPAFAAKTGFSYADLDNFLFALTRCFGDYNVDGSSARPGGMRVVGLVDFEHKDALGNAPAHKVLDMVKVTGKKKPGTEVFESGSEFPHGLHDYAGSAPDGPIYVAKNKYDLVIACSPIKPPMKDGNEAVSPITAHRLVWALETPDAK